jgi:NADPH-dependent ferric siderophore reductase
MAQFGAFRQPVTKGMKMMEISPRLFDMPPSVRRLRHEPRRRALTVARTERLTPAMIRVTLTGEDLADFASASPDDHVKLAFPGPDGAELRRDYTPRRFDAGRRELVIDLVDHDGGPAAGWARTVREGDVLGVGGPRGSAVIEGPVARWLLVGDESALPAIGRRVEELAFGTPVTTLVAVPGAADRQSFTTAARHHALWLYRPLAQAADPEPFLAALGNIEIAHGTFVWIAAEAGVARTLRETLVARGVPKQWIKAAGYWIAGHADASVKALDD